MDAEDSVVSLMTYSSPNVINTFGGKKIKCMCT